MDEVEKGWIQADTKNSVANLQSSHDKPIQKKEKVLFSRNEHGPRLRRQSRICSPDDYQYILFVLDTSGSVGLQNFEEMKKAIADLVPLFCKKIKVALITFSRDIILEFCFNCFTNTLSGRTAATNAIKGAQYQGRATNTGSTVRCIKDDILKENCGITANPNCLDIIFITDGKSNDGHRHKVCDEMKQLNDIHGIHTFGIGINSGPGYARTYDEDELDCLSKDNENLIGFEYDSFDDFKQSIEGITATLTEEVIGGNLNACAGRDQ